MTRSAAAREARVERTGTRNPRKKNCRQARGRASRRNEVAGAVAPYEPTMQEILSAVASLCQDQLRPYGRILRKRLVELKYPHAGPEDPPPAIIDVGRLRGLCEKMWKLQVVVADEADWSVVLEGASENFVDIYDGDDYYPEELWTKAADYFSNLGEDEMNLPGGRYVSAQGLKALNLPFLKGFSLGMICHFVQIAMTKRKLLGYSNGAIVPYGRSQTALREHCAQQLSLCKTQRCKMPPVTWEKLRDCVVELLAADTGGLPLSNVKRMLRARFGIDLSETALGHASVSELFKDRRLADLCSVVLLDNGYYVFSPKHRPSNGPAAAAATESAKAVTEDKPAKEVAAPTTPIARRGRQASVLLSTTPPTTGSGSTTRSSPLSSPQSSKQSPQAATNANANAWDLTRNALGMGPWCLPDLCSQSLWQLPQLPQLPGAPANSVPSYSATKAAAGAQAGMSPGAGIAAGEARAVEKPKPRLEPLNLAAAVGIGVQEAEELSTSSTENGSASPSEAVSDAESCSEGLREHTPARLDRSQEDDVLRFRPLDELTREHEDRRLNGRFGIPEVTVRNTFIDIWSPTKRSRRAVSESRPPRNYL